MFKREDGCVAERKVAQDYEGEPNAQGYRRQNSLPADASPVKKIGNVNDPPLRLN